MTHLINSYTKEGLVQVEVITLMGVVALGLKCAAGVTGTIGVIAGVNWFNKKDFKKKGSASDDDIEHEPKRVFR